MNKLLTIALLFSIVVNTVVVGSLFFIVKSLQPQVQTQSAHIEESTLLPSDKLWISSDEHAMVVTRADSLKHNYVDKLIVLHEDINRDRKKIVPMLLENPIDKNNVDKILIEISEKQGKAEKLTIEHIINLKDEISKKEWIHIVKQLDPEVKHKHIIINHSAAQQIDIDTNVENFQWTIPESSDQIQVQQLKVRRNQ